MGRPGFGQAVLTGADAAQLSADDEPVAVNDDNYEVQEDGQIGILALNSGAQGRQMRRSSVAVMGEKFLWHYSGERSFDQRGTGQSVYFWRKCGSGSDVGPY